MTTYLFFLLAPKRVLTKKYRKASSFLRSCRRDFCPEKKCVFHLNQPVKKEEGNSNKNLTPKTSNVALVIQPKIISVCIPSPLT